MDSTALLIKELFGEDGEEDNNPPPHPPVVVSRSHAIAGLSLIHGFLGPHELQYYEPHLQEELSSQSNQRMIFGLHDLPSWAMQLAVLIKSKVECIPQEAMESEAPGPPLLPLHLLQRQPLFDQLIINSYRPGEGITPHVDLETFEDGIAVVSFGGPAIMNFTPLPHPAAEPPPPHIASPHTPGPAAATAFTVDHRYQVLLSPGDLLLMHGEARWGFRHGIDQVHHEVYYAAKSEMPVTKEDQMVVRSNRISITLRRLVPDITLQVQG